MPGVPRLSVFLGEWRVEGAQHESPVGTAASVTARESFEWLQGEKFLIHRFDGRVGELPAACVEIISAPRRGGHAVRTFYNNGVENVWQLREESGLWTLAGDWSVNGTPATVRCLTTFSADLQQRTCRWEYSTDQRTWQTFWDLVATRVPAAQ